LKKKLKWKSALPETSDQELLTNIEGRGGCDRGRPGSSSVQPDKEESQGGFYRGSLCEGTRSSTSLRSFKGEKEGKSPRGGVVNILWTSRSLKTRTITNKEKEKRHRYPSYSGILRQELRRRNGRIEEGGE